MKLPRLPIIIVVDLLLLYGVTLMYAQGEVVFAVLVLALAVPGSWLLSCKKHGNYRLLFPCLTMVAVGTILPLLYTINIAFTNYSAEHRLSYQRARTALLSESWHPAGEHYRLKLFREGAKLRLMLIGSAGSEEHFLTEPVMDSANSSTRQTVAAFISSHRPAGAELPADELGKKSTMLANLVIILPDGTEVTMVAPGVFGTSARSYRVAVEHSYPDQSLDLIDNRTGETLYADITTGDFIRASRSKPVGPGFIIYTGWDNFVRIFTDPAIHHPLLKTFVWSVIFAAISVALSLTIGLLLANLLHWEPLPEKKIYRVLLVVPYAVPLFIAALMFRGLFHQDSGNINLLLFGSRLPWFSNALLAKTMVIMVNTWLSYPYMMILCTGLLTGIPDDLYEASAIDGASPVQNLVHITIPMIIKPLVPVLIACFAYNVNNLVLIAMLTDGAAHMPDSPVGATDVVASYAYQTAFVSHDYALAAAVATLVFVLTGGIAWLNLLATKRLQ